jgi:predicted RND superfamily exporter protein
MDRFVDRMARLQAAHPWWFIAAAAVVTALAMALAAGLRFDSSYEALLPSDSPEVRNMDDIRARTGGTRQLVVAIGGGEREGRIAFARRLVPRLEEIPETRFVDLELPVGFFHDRGLLLMETGKLDALVGAVEEAIAASKWQLNPMNPHLDDEEESAEVDRLWKKVEDIVEEEKGRVPANGMYESSDGRYLFVLVTPSIRFSDMDAAVRYMQEVESTVGSLDPASEGLEVRYAGQLELIVEQQITMKRDLRNASILALLLCVLVVALFTRRPSAPLVIGVPLAAGVAWTFAIVRLAIGHVNIVTGFLTSVIIGLGIDFGIHLFIRYQQERLSGDPSAAEAMARAVGGTFRPALTSALTTVGTFAVFMVAAFRGFSEFGLIAALGVLFTFSSAFLVLPPIVVLVDRGRAVARRKISTFRQHAIPAPAALIVVAAFVAAAVFGAGSIDKVRFFNDLKKLRGVSPAMEFFEYVDESLGRRFNPAVIIVGSVEDASTATRAIRDASAADPGTLIDRAYSIADFLPADTDARMERIARLKELVDDPKLDRTEQRRDELDEARVMVDVRPWGVDDVPESVRRRFVTVDGRQQIVYVWPRRSNVTDEDMFAWEAELGRVGGLLRARGIGFKMVEETLIVAWVSRMVRQEAPELVLISSLVVFLLLLIDLRRVGRSLLVATPLVAGMLCFAALMKVTGQNLNLFNIVVVPSIIGIGIDNSVHIYHRYRAEGRGSILTVVRLTGMATLLASLTTAVGFGSALVSHHLGLRTMGLLAASGISTTFVTATIFFPCLLVLVEWVSGRIARRR